MTALQALAVLEAVVLECKKRSIDTPEVREALYLLEPHIRPEWLIPQFRHHALKARGDKVFEREGQQQVLRPSFDGIRDSVRELVGKKMDALAREFAANHDMKVKEEIERLAKGIWQAQGAVGVRGEV